MAYHNYTETNPDFVDVYRRSQDAILSTISDDDYNDVCSCLTDANRFKNVDYKHIADLTMCLIVQMNKMIEIETLPETQKNRM